MLEAMALVAVCLLGLAVGNPVSESYVDGGDVDLAQAYQDLSGGNQEIVWIDPFSEPGEIGTTRQAIEVEEDWTEIDEEVTVPASVQEDDVGSAEEVIEMGDDAASLTMIAMSLPDSAATDADVISLATGDKAASVYGCWSSSVESVLASWCKCESLCSSASSQADAERCQSDEGASFRSACSIRDGCLASTDAAFPCQSETGASYGDITCPEMMGNVVLSVARCQQALGEFWADGSSRCSEATSQEIKVCSEGGWTVLTYPSAVASCYKIGNLTGTGSFGCPFFQATTFTVMAAYESNGLDIDSRVVKYNFNDDLQAAAELKERQAVLCTDKIKVNCTKKAT